MLDAAAAEEEVTRETVAMLTELLPATRDTVAILLVARGAGEEDCCCCCWPGVRLEGTDAIAGRLVTIEVVVTLGRAAADTLDKNKQKNDLNLPVYTVQVGRGIINHTRIFTCTYLVVTIIGILPRVPVPYR
jgi:hypothetical protein